MMGCCKRKKKEQTDRSFKVGEPTQSRFISNQISTTRYSAWNFLPLSLLYQFSRYANIYFLINAILQSIPAISPLSPLSAIVPLIFVIMVSIIREGFEDLQRYRSDEETNSAKTRRFEGEEEVEVMWKDLKVGDVVRVMSDEFVPADLVVLASSEQKGACFIMTSPLDGERNLKPRFALQGTQTIFGEAGVERPEGPRRPEVGDTRGTKGFEGQGGGGKVSRGLKRPEGPIRPGGLSEAIRLGGRESWGSISLTCGPPSSELGDFGGTLEQRGTKSSLTSRQLLLRGSQLSNTDWAVGVVAYTGGDTKIMNNSDEPVVKHSTLEVMMNGYILGLVGLQLAMCIATFVGAWVWNSKLNPAYSYFVETRGSAFSEAVMVFFTMWILLNSMIPISLVISLEMVKLAQAFLIEKDIDMFDPVERRYAKVLSSALNEELGQIQYVFTDKTGTLTCNVMEFKYCLVGGKLFENQPDEAASPPNPVDGVGAPLRNPELASLLSGSPGEQIHLRLFSRGRELFSLRDLGAVARTIFLTMATCHECQTDRRGGGKLLGPSPDELALVATARANGFEFLTSTGEGRVLRVNGVEIEIPVLAVFEFSSARQRASVVVRHEGVVKLLCKGADSAILERLDRGEAQRFSPAAGEALGRFAAQGLRTLCFGIRVFDESEWLEIAASLASAGDAARRAAVAEEAEMGLTLLGCSAVEDRLQEGVPETIADLLSANIKVWMLTGDKLETAENIGYACRLVQPGFRKLYIRSETELPTKLNEFSGFLNRDRRESEKFCLILEGKALAGVTRRPSLAPRLVDEIFSRVDSVICCRMSPRQKAEIVRMIRRFGGKITLAIGDGANDANMIQAAHVGVGLFGREGLQAVQASDFALPGFKAIWKLIFVHGRWAYMRNAEMILYFYYKNIVVSVPAWLFGFYNGFSGQTLFDDYYLTFYNLAFTAFPVIARAILDQDVYYRDWGKFEGDPAFQRNLLFDLKDLRTYYPHLYYVGQMNLIFTTRNFASWIFAGVGTSIVVFWFAKETFGSGLAGAGGPNPDLWFFSITLFSSVILAVQVKICAFTRTFTWINLLSVLVLSILLYFVYFLVADVISAFKIFRTALAVLSSPLPYLFILLTSCLFFIGDLLYLAVKREVETPLYLMFRSLEEEKHDIDKIEAYEVLVREVQNRILSPEELRAARRDQNFRNQIKRKQKDKDKDKDKDTEPLTPPPNPPSPIKPERQPPISNPKPFAPVGAEYPFEQKEFPLGQFQPRPTYATLQTLGRDTPPRTPSPSPSPYRRNSPYLRDDFYQPPPSPLTPPLPPMGSMVNNYASPSPFAPVGSIPRSQSKFL